MSTLAGSPSSEECHRDGTASAACFSEPEGVAVDIEGNVIVADTDNHCIRKVAPDGTVSTLAGSTSSEEGHQDGTASSTLARWQ